MTKQYTYTRKLIRGTSHETYDAFITQAEALYNKDNLKDKLTLNLDDFIELCCEHCIESKPNSPDEALKSWVKRYSEIMEKYKR